MSTIAHLLRAIANSIDRPQPHRIVVQLNGTTTADVIRELERRRQRNGLSA